MAKLEVKFPLPSGVAFWVTLFRVIDTFHGTQAPGACPGKITTGYAIAAYYSAGGRERAGRCGEINSLVAMGPSSPVTNALYLAVAPGFWYSSIIWTSTSRGCGPMTGPMNGNTIDGAFPGSFIKGLCMVTERT